MTLLFMSSLSCIHSSAVIKVYLYKRRLHCLCQCNCHGQMQCDFVALKRSKRVSQLESLTVKKEQSVNFLFSSSEFSF